MDRRDFLKSVSILLTSSVLSENVIIKEAFANLGQGRGIIFVVGDGWPLGVTKGLYEIMERKFNERSVLMELMRDSKVKMGLSNTSSLSSIVTDSAPASAAWATGSKTINRSLSSLPDGRKLTTIFELAKEKGMSCGVVTTTRVTHATPAAWYSHNQNRDDEDNIALDILKLGLDVAMGGGERHFNPKTRKDGQDLFSQFSAKGYIILREKSEISKAMDKERPILGVFNSSHLSYYLDRVNDKSLGEREPSLPEMTALALNKLSKNPKGFILQVEAGRIDHANHANDAYTAIWEAYELDKTLAVILEYMKKNPNCLLIVTSDHGNSAFGINGTGKEYNDATKALMFYNQSASFEYIIKKMKGQDIKTIKEIFETYTNTPITLEEALEIYNKLYGKRVVLVNDFWYEPEATMGSIMRRSIYEADDKGKITHKNHIRRGNVGFSSTNHTAEDQLVVIYSPNFNSSRFRPFMDNTELFHIMCEYLGITFENPKMTAYEAKKFAKEISKEGWERHLELHIS